MTDDELDELLGGYEVPAPPEGFADRVMAEAAPARAPATRSRAPWLIGASVAAAAAAAIALWPAAPVVGELSATERTEVELADRGVAVAEAGADLAWTVEGESADVEQPAGDVFYRVEPSERFVVHTPAGDVSVRGTCFRVEVSDMNVSPQLYVGAAVGALVAGSVAVTVYEGEVDVRNDHGEVSLAAGERSVLTPSEAPSAPAEATDRPELSGEPARSEAPTAEEIDAMDTDALRARLRTLSSRDREQAHEIERLRGLIEDADLQADAGRGHFFPASREQLQQWAEACQLRLDQPPVMGMEPGRLGDHRETLGLSAEEAEVVQEAIEHVHASLTEDLRALYVEATGDVAGASQLSPRAMLAEIQDKASQAERDRRIMNLIARERAGLATPPPPDAELSPTERAVRRYARVGDDFQRRLAQSLGPQRAHELRAQEGGWPWSHSIFSGCPDR